MSSKVEEIKSAICEFFNNHEIIDCLFIKSPTNAPAPIGTYVAVKMEEIEQAGNMMEPPPGEGVPFVFEQVGTISFTEVEGDGEILRMVRNAIQRKNFIEFAKNNDFTIWDFSNIMPIDTYDGEFYVRQWRFTMQVNFEDVEIGNIAKIETVDFNLTER